MIDKCGLLDLHGLDLQITISINNFDLVALDRPLNHMIHVMDEKLCMVLLCVPVVPNNATLSDVNIGAFNVLSVPIHHIFYLGNPREVFDVSRSVPFAAIAAFVKVAGLGHEPELLTIEIQRLVSFEPAFCGCG